jgi:hypothetical protein
MTTTHTTNQDLDDNLMTTENCRNRQTLRVEKKASLGCKPPEGVEGKKIANFQNNHFEMNKMEQTGYICLGEVNTATL